MPSPDAAALRQRLERRLHVGLVALGACRRRSLSICWSRTAALSTFRMSMEASSVGLEAVDADDRLVAGIDARLRAGGGLLDAQLRDAGLDRLRHAAEALDLLDVRPRLLRELVASAARRSRSRPTDR